MVVFPCSRPRDGVCKVSMQPRPWLQVPEQTALVARSAFPKGSLAMAVGDRLGEVFSDTEFAAAFGVRGAPAESSGRLALVTALQYVEGLTDRQAAVMVARAIDWRYALGLELTDPGFDHSVLSKFWARVVAHGLEEKALDLLMGALRSTGLVAAGGKARTDSTHVICAVGGPEPPRAGRAERAGVCRGAGGCRAGLAHLGDRRARLESALRAPGRFLAAAHLADQAQ